MKIFMLLALALGLQGCAAAFQNRVENLDRGPKEIEPVYATQKDSVLYRLSVMPQWANFSTSGECFRETFVEYLDYDLLAKNFRLSYPQSVMMQKVWNYKRYGQHAKEGQKNFSSDRRGRFYSYEDQLFFEALEQVTAGRVPMKKLKVAGVNVIWIDPLVKEYAQGEAQPEKLKTFFRGFFEQPDFLKFPHVFLSVCLAHDEMVGHLKNLFGVSEENYWGLISSEMFAIYDQGGQKRPKIFLDLPNFFEVKNKDITFYSPEVGGREAKVPGEVEGFSTLKKFKVK